jgi:hypothetical protein
MYVQVSENKYSVLVAYRMNMIGLICWVYTIHYVEGVVKMCIVFSS